MSNRGEFESAVLTLLIICSTLAGATAVSGAAAQSGSIVLEEGLTSETSEFEATVTSLDGTDFGTGCVVVENSNREEFFIERGVSEGATVTITADDVGGLSVGDEITATLYEEPERCEGELDTDRTTVQAPASFEVQLTQVDESVAEGDTVSVDYTIENTGGAADTQDVVFTVNGEVVDVVEAVELASGDTFSGTFTYQTEDGDAPGILVAVETEDSAREREVSVEEQAPASFDVTIESTNSPVTEGNTLEVVATIENTGDATGSQSVRLFIGDAIVQTKSVELAGGEATTETFEWVTESGTADDYIAIVESEDDEDAVDVLVTEPGGFQVEIDGTTSPVGTGETLNVTATVQNTGNSADSQEITLEIDGEAVDSTVVTLAGGESRTLFFEWTPEPGESGDYVATVKTIDSSASIDVRVEEGAAFQVAIDSTNTPVSEGIRFEADVTVENTGEIEGTKELQLRIDDRVVETLSVTLGSGELDTVSLFWNTQEGDAGTYTATVTTEGSSDSTGIRITETGGMTVSIDETTTPVAAGEPMEVIATVKNTGATSTTQPIGLTIDGERVDSTTVTLDGNESRTITLTWATESGDAGEYTAEVSSEDDTASTAVTVTEPAEFVVAIDDTNTPVVEGETLDVTATVQNVGETSATQQIRLALDGTQQTSQAVSLDGGESTTVTLSWGTEPGDAGGYTATVESDDDTASADVRVEGSSGTETPGGAAGFEVTIESTNTPVGAGETVEVTAQVTNTGSESRTEQITLRAAGADRDSQAVTLDGGESTTVTFTWDTAGDDAGEYTAAVAGETDDATTPVAVEGASAGGTNSTFGVSIDEVSTPDGGSGTFEVDTTVENTGDVADTQTITLTSGGETRGSQDVSLAPGESQTITFTWEQESGAEFDIEVSSETDSDTSSAAVDGGGDDGGPVSTTSILLFLLLLIILAAAYYYVRRRQRSESTYAEDDGSDAAGEADDTGGRGGPGGRSGRADSGQSDSADTSDDIGNRQTRIGDPQDSNRGDKNE